MILTIRIKKEERFLPREVIIPTVGMVDFFAGDKHYKRPYAKREEHKEAFLIVSCPYGSYKLTFEEDEYAVEEYKKLKKAILSGEQELTITAKETEFWRR